MKFYDNAGNKHNTIIGAYLYNVQRKVDNTIRDNVPGYDAVTNKCREIKNEIIGGMGKIHPSTMYGEFINPDNPLDESDLFPNDGEDSELAADVEYDDPQVEDDKPDIDCETSSDKIRINYTMKRMELYDEGGKLIATSPIEDVLLNQILAPTTSLDNSRGISQAKKMPKITILTPSSNEDDIEG